MRSGRAVVQLFGRLQDGPPFSSRIRAERPYFFVRVGGCSARVEGRAEVASTGLSDLAGKPVARVSDLARRGRRPRLACGGVGVESLEADIRFPYRYLDRRGRARGRRDRGRGTLRGGLVRFADPDARARRGASGAARRLARPRDWIRAASEIWSVALRRRRDRRGAPRRARRRSRARSRIPTSARCSPRRRSGVREVDPDVLTGWNVVDFDLRRLVARAVGAARPARARPRRRARCCFQQELGFTREARAIDPGRVIVLDGLALVRDALRARRLSRSARSRESCSAAASGSRPVARPRRRDRAHVPRGSRRAVVAYNREDARPRARHPRARRRCSRSRSSAACSRACSSTASARASRRSTCSTCPSCAGAASRRRSVDPRAQRRAVGAGRRGARLGARRVHRTSPCSTSRACTRA